MRCEAEEGYVSDALVTSPEVLAENRFLAARDGAVAALIDPVRETRVPVATLLEELMEAARPHAVRLGCESQLSRIHELVESPAAARQLDLARTPKRLPGLVEQLAAAFVD